MTPARQGGWVLADIGNSRTKLVWLASGAHSVDRLFLDSTKTWDERLTLPTDRIEDQADALKQWLKGKSISGIWLASVHQLALNQLVGLLDQALEETEAEDADGSILTSAMDVDVHNRLDFPERTGVDRALAIRAALRLHNRKGPGIVVMCGTAMTVERIDTDGVWIGGAIAPGYRLAAKALDQGTSGLMQVGAIAQAPLAHGAQTKSAIEAGLFWGQVGTAKELIARAGSLPDSWEIWSGGDASLFARWASTEHAELVDDLVLMGLADFAAAGLDGQSV
ncbi:MAG: type III pantothenate kinase [Planctomycetota bacterium]|nr:type III pantothenate kinase [Planctomycetota bacterium]